METLLKNARMINEGTITEGDLLIKDDRIEHIGTHISPHSSNVRVLDLEGRYLIPGIIDDQVHFREPGLTHKGDISTESRAAIAGGITSYMEQPNTKPAALTQELLEEKYQRAAQVSLANYSFNMGVSDDNLDEVFKTDPKRVAGIKVFMGSSTGNMLVENEKVLNNLFANAPTMIITHCEDEATITRNFNEYYAKYGDNIPFSAHPLIRSEEACFKSSSYAISLAKKHNARLHVFHISTAKEAEQFSNSKPLHKKLITSEVCIHHLWFSDEDYAAKGSLIKWNPAVKTAKDRDGLWKALLNDKIDVVATDHAPHTLAEKQNPYTSAPSGGPLVQHALVAMLENHHRGRISLEKIVEKMCHNPAIMFQIKERGFLREGYKADLAVFDLSNPWTVNSGNILSKCGWSPFENNSFRARVMHTFVNGQWVYKNGKIDESVRGERLLFDRD